LNGGGVGGKARATQSDSISTKEITSMADKIKRVVLAFRAASTPA
jgi:hypothetical protein